MIDKKSIYYMSLAKLASEQSKDPNTKVGACIIKDGRVLSLGWNGPPRNMDDSIVPFECRDQSKPLRDQKYPYILHAEVNAILNYSGQMQDLIGSTLYVTVFPCHRCALQIIQAGIKEIYYIYDYIGDSESDNMSKYLLDICNINYHKIEV